MSYPYPQDRHRDRKEKGDQSYKNAKEAMSQNTVEQQIEEMAYNEAHQHETPEERLHRVEDKMADRFAEANREISGNAGRELGEADHEDRT
jgi:hypothetical protein